MILLSDIINNIFVMFKWNVNVISSDPHWKDGNFYLQRYLVFTL